MSDRVLLPKARVVFVNVFEPNDKGKYALCMLFDKGTNLDELKTLANETAEEKYGKKIPKNFNYPWKDGNDKDEEDYPDFQNKIVVNAKSIYQPTVVDEDVEIIINPKEFYSGCYARASVTASCYDVDGNKGINLYLQNVQKLGDGERIGGGVEAKDEFQAVAREENSTVESDFNI